MSEVLISILWVSFIFQSLKEISEHYELPRAQASGREGKSVSCVFYKK